MEQSFAVISLILLVVAIIIGFWRKINMGIIAIVFSLILVRMAGLKDSAALGSFGTSLFLRLLGVMLLFSIAQTNHTIERLTKKLASMSGKTVRLLPVFMFILFWFVAALGAGGPAALALAAIVTVPIAYELNISPLKLTPAAIWGSIGANTPLNSVGILAQTLAGDAGIEVDLMKMSITGTLGMIILFAIWYVASGWLKMDIKPLENQAATESLDKNNYITLCGFIVLIILAFFLKVDIGLAGFASAFCLIIIPGVVEDRKAIAAVPWNTLLMIGGMGMLISVVQQLGGIDLLSNGIAAMMSVGTAPAILSLMGSIMSTVSSTTGVVMPTLIPTVPGIIEAIGGGNAQEFVYAITFGAGLTVISPLSTGGALLLAAYSNTYKPTTEERSKIFVELIVYAIAQALLFGILGLVGFYGWFL